MRGDQVQAISNLHRVIGSMNDGVLFRAEARYFKLRVISYLWRSKFVRDGFNASVDNKVMGSTAYDRCKYGQRRLKFRCSMLV